jgi:hypothetical protein
LKIENSSLKRYILIAAIAIPLVFAAATTGTISINAFVQGQGGTGSTFTVKGYTGQIIVLPPNSFAPPTPSQTVAPPVGSIIGGNWSVSVNNGKVQDFKWDVNHYTLSCSVA